ncbi:protein with peptidoglycan-binding domain protein [Chimaeribacter arupi]|uniref:NlpC/P60 family protein n=1 Tax=Chimaeribacter arupi TaxID=2060066 RepID=UPI000C7D3BD3|nr:peptidoglycan-binding protein [Chimaeribacter arupi]PLR45362.1 protein with peptidoglycan-binding domain protein [Chimaeribacter arupi]
MSDYPSLDVIQAETHYPGPVAQDTRSGAVKRVQEWLTFHGHGLVIDGDFGAATQRALAAFRQSAGLQDNGPVNSEDWAQLVAPMLRVLKLPARSTTLPETLLKVARQHLAVHPVELGGQNRGPWVRLYCNGQEGEGVPWCAGFVNVVLRQACAVQEIPLPLALSLSCDALARSAREQGRFIPGVHIDSGNTPWSDVAQVGLFLVKQGPDHWRHTGFAFDGVDHTFQTVEGNADNQGSGNGFDVCTRTLSVQHCDFVILA